MNLDRIASNLIKHAKGHFDAQDHVMSVLWQVRCDIFLMDQVGYGNPEERYSVRSVDRDGVALIAGLKEEKVHISKLTLRYRPVSEFDSPK